ncbi:hypothetical protein M3Y99_01590800 [Aphelenchoides fujianensis]|nr:hypothetical protein M3Y99_01590800 [Aphelenchoides fujianensis]
MDAWKTEQPTDVQPAALHEKQSPSVADFIRQESSLTSEADDERSEEEPTEEEPKRPEWTAEEEAEMEAITNAPFDHHYRLPSNVDELRVEESPSEEQSEPTSAAEVVEAVREKRKSEDLEVFDSAPFGWAAEVERPAPASSAGGRQRSHSGVTVSYTDRLRRSLPHEYVHSALSIDADGDELLRRQRKRWTERSSSVNVIYSGHSLPSSQRKLSWTAGATTPRPPPTPPQIKSEITPPPPIEITPPADVQPEGLNAFESCERRPAPSGELCGIDFMVQLNFMAGRLTENIAEAAAEDLSKVIQIRSNPRARYFCDEYLLDFLTSQSESEEEEDVREEEERPTFDHHKPEFEVETIREPAVERPAFDIFGMFRRKSTVERPRSALAFLQQRRYSPLPVPEVDSRKSSEVKAGDIMQLLRRTSIESADSSRADSSFNLPPDVLEGLSAEEREHIQRVMSSASRSHTTPQESRRPSSAMVSLPDMNELDVRERRHIAEVVQKAEQRQAPFVIAPAIGKSKSTGDRLDETEFEAINTQADVPPPSEPAGLTDEEIAHIARVQEMIAASEAEDERRRAAAEIEAEFRRLSLPPMLSPNESGRKNPRASPTPPPVEQKSTPFGGFRMGVGSLRSALKKTQQRVNENVNAIVQQTSGVVEKPAGFTDSLRKFAKQTPAESPASGGREIEAVRAKDDVQQPPAAPVEVFELRTSVDEREKKLPTVDEKKPEDAHGQRQAEELDFTPKFAPPPPPSRAADSPRFVAPPPPATFERNRMDERPFAREPQRSSLDSETATSTATASSPSPTSSSTGSADDQQLADELDEAVVCADENIAWLQERIEAMNQTLEAYETQGESFDRMRVAGHSLALQFTLLPSEYANVLGVFSPRRV